MAIGWNIGTAGGNKLVVTATVGTAGGNKTILNGWIGTAGGNKQFFANLSATTTGGVGTRSGPGVVNTSSPSVVTVTGGTAPYSFLWNLVTPSSPDATSATVSMGQSTYFTANASASETLHSTWNCTVTDFLGNTTDTNTVTVTLIAT